MGDLHAAFMPGQMVKIDDIAMRVVTVEFSWGMTFARYQCEWFSDGHLETKWFHEPSLEAA